MDVLRVFGAVVLGGSLAVAAQNASPSDPPANEVDSLRASVAAAPNDAESHFKLGDALEKSGDLIGAESEFKQSLALQEKNPNALGALAYLYATQKRFADAEIALRSYVARDPKNAKAHVQLGSVLLSSGKKDEAAKEFTAALALAPSDPGILMQVAQLYSSHEMYAQAEPLFSRLTQSSPSDAEGHYGYGLVLLQQRKFEGALEQFRRSVILRRDLKEAYGDLAVAASEVGDYPQAITALNLRAQYLPETPGTYFLRATSYDHLKDFPSAADNYKKFLAADGGKSPNQEWQARHRLVAIEKK